MAGVMIVNDLESAGRGTPKKTTNPDTIPNIQSDNTFQDLQDSENRPSNLQKNWGASKRKKSTSSPPPGDHPKKKKDNKCTNQHLTTASDSREGGQTQQEREVEGSGAKGSRESVGLTARTRRKTIGSHTGVRTQRQKRIEDKEVRMEEEVEMIAANSRPPNHEEGEPENRPPTGRLPCQLGEYIQNPTYSVNLNQITEPSEFEFTSGNEIRDSHFFWRKYKDKIAPDKPDNSKASMHSLGRVQGIQDPELRNTLQDPIKRSGIYTGVLREEMEKASKEVIMATRDGLKEK